MADIVKLMQKQPDFYAMKGASEEEIRMAKEMGLNPKSLIKNIPNKSEQWKAPVKEWIHDMYDKRQEKSRKKAERKTKVKNNI